MVAYSAFSHASCRLEAATAELRRSLSHLVRGMQGRAAAAHSSLRRPAGTVQLRSVWGEAGRRSGAASCCRAGLPGGSLGHPGRCAAQHCGHYLWHVSARPPELLSIMLVQRAPCYWRLHGSARAHSQECCQHVMPPGLAHCCSRLHGLPGLTVRSAATMSCLRGLQRAWR